MYAIFVCTLVSLIHSISKFRRLLYSLSLNYNNTATDQGDPAKLTKSLATVLLEPLVIA